MSITSSHNMIAARPDLKSGCHLASLNTQHVGQRMVRLLYYAPECVICQIALPPFLTAMQACGIIKEVMSRAEGEYAL